MNEFTNILFSLHHCSLAKIIQDKEKEVHGFELFQTSN